MKQFPAEHPTSSGLLDIPQGFRKFELHQAVRPQGSSKGDQCMVLRDLASIFWGHQGMLAEIRIRAHVAILNACQRLHQVALT